MKFGFDYLMRGRLLVAVLAISLSGCAHDSKPVQFYMLNATLGLVSRPQGHQATAQGPVIGLGPIRIPEYLNRPQMVMAVNDNQFLLDEDHRWAERLDQNILLALFKALPVQLNTDRMVRYPWSQRQVLDYQVGIDILEFNVDANGQSRLVAQWFIKHKDQPVVDKRSTYQFPASTTDYSVMVAAQSLCLTKLGQEISENLRQLMLSSVSKSNIN